RSLGTIQNGDASGRFPNQVRSASNGTDFVNAHYDDAGNLADLVVQRTGTCAADSGACTHRFAYDWDEVGQLRRGRRWDYAGGYPSSAPTYPRLPNASPVVDVTVAYDAAGERVLKTVSAERLTNYSAEVFASLRLDGASFDGTDYQRTQDTEQVYLVLG